MAEGSIQYVYLTRRCLKTGVILKRRAVVQQGEPIVHVQAGRPGEMHRCLRLGRDVFLTEAEALEDAQRRRERKIADAERKIAKYRELSFQVLF